MQKTAKRYEIDMTNGALLPKVLLYALPLVATGILQLLYNAADVIVVGNYAGAQALAAVGSTGSLINLMVNVFMGLSVGASVVIARGYGAQDDQRIHRGVHTAMTLALISGFIVMLIGVFFSRPMLQLMGSPDDVIDNAALYMRIYFIGMPFNMLYTFGAAVLRAVGDTRRPLYYLTFSGIVNVLLNLVLVIAFKMGVAGVAIATVVSQIISMILVLRCLLRSRTAIRLEPKKMRLDPVMMKQILQIGLPAGLQGSLFSVSNVFVQSAVNSFGSVVMAGNAAASNLEGFVYTAMNSIYQADMTFASANMGAGKHDRVRKVLWVCQGTVITIGLVMGYLFLTLGKPLIGLYNSDPEVIRFALVRFGVFMPTYFICGMMDVMVGQMRGIGYSFIPMIVSLTGACLLRIVWIQTVFQAYHTQLSLYICYPVTWAVTFAAHMITYLIVSKKLRRHDKPVRVA